MGSSLVTREEGGKERELDGGGIGRERERERERCLSERGRNVLLSSGKPPFKGFSLLGASSSSPAQK